MKLVRSRVKSFKMFILSSKDDYGKSVSTFTLFIFVGRRFSFKVVHFGPSFKFVGIKITSLYP
jgi:hypothetical protein